jgi:(1->4)-alpha-D-glucan 1-alpha-D-glucosylmutase
MAKGVEDTALYRFAPLSSLAEVGAEPNRDLRRATERLHEENAERARAHPRSLLAATTHDTKRSADTRARLHVLSFMADEWCDRLERWYRDLAPSIVGRDMPDARTCHGVFQSMVGAWPTSDGDVPGAPTLAAFAERIAQYARKAAREAKLHTTWTDPDEGHEGRLDRFVRKLLDPAEGAEFQRDVARWVARIAPSAAWIAVARRVLQLTSPGVPDVYQGDETTFLALVDPDNRRPVDFESLEARLAEAELAGRSPARATQVHALRNDPTDGRLALHVVHGLLRARADDPAPFRAGDYRPLEVRGPRARDVFAFARLAGGEALLVAVPRSFRPSDGATAPFGVSPSDWAGHELVIPRDVDATRWVSPLTGEACDHCRPGYVALDELFAALPLAVFFARPGA